MRSSPVILLSNSTSTTSLQGLILGPLCSGEGADEPGANLSSQGPVPERPSVSVPIVEKPFSEVKLVFIREWLG